MECEEVGLCLWEYLDQELAPEEAVAVGAHLEGCFRCYPAYCWNRSFLELLARQRASCCAPAALRLSVCRLLASQ
ncbi:MAG TPA: zf-HC2 domain-containing protein [Gemmatimonadales bacterium]|jgi:hypothetical protein